jgi:hypothetical protein
MAKQRTHSIDFKRQVAQEFLAGENPKSQNFDLKSQRRWVPKVLRPRARLREVGGGAAR